MKYLNMNDDNHYISGDSAYLLRPWMQCQYTRVFFYFLTGNVQQGNEFYSCNSRT